MTSLPVYLDYAATTPADPQVIAAMMECLGMDGVYGNPASTSHGTGGKALRRVDQARKDVAALIGAQAGEIVWTSGATESTNLALKGVAQYAATAAAAGAAGIAGTSGVAGIASAGGLHIITSGLEHKATLDTVTHLQSLGARVTIVAPDEHGAIDAGAVRKAIDRIAGSGAAADQTLLVSLMMVNNEIGTLTDVGAVAAAVHAAGGLLHVDAAQALGKVAIDVDALGIDLMSMSAHKIYGPKGIGALYVRDSIKGRLVAQMHGGGHERGLRSGTLATHQIVGMGTACTVAQARLAEDHAHISGLYARLHDGIAALPGVSRNGAGAACVPNIVNLCLDLPGFMPFLLAADLEVSSTSACNSASGALSHVLLGIGRSREQASRSVRLSLGRFTTMTDVDRAVATIAGAVANCTKSLAA